MPTNENPKENQTSLAEWNEGQADSTTEQPTEQATDQPSVDSNPESQIDVTRGSFTFTRKDLPTSEGRLDEKAISALLGDAPAPPLTETVSTLSQHNPTPTDTETRIARALYIYGRAQIDSLPGYNLSESMLDLRGCIDDELDLSTQSLIERGFLTRKLVDGRQKYFSLSTTGRKYLADADHPDISLLKPNVEHPVLRDGVVHNFGVKIAGSAITDCSRVAQPDLSGRVSIDLGGYDDGERIQVGEVITTEDLSSATNEDSTLPVSIRSRIQYLGEVASQSLLVFETSPVAVATLEQLDRENEIDIPETITYRNYSIAQLRDRVLPEIDHGAFDQLATISSLLRDQ